VDYLYLICELAAAFAGFTAIVAVLHPDADAAADDLILNKLRLRQMLEISLFTVAAGLTPQLVMSLGAVHDVAMRIAGGIFGLGAIMLMIVQVRRGSSRHLRTLSGYSLPFFRAVVIMGGVSVIAFFLAASGVAEPTGWYLLGITMGLAVAALQFLRTATTVLRVHGAAKSDVATSERQLF
jgi:hypothetical protein